MTTYTPTIPEHLARKAICYPLKTNGSKAMNFELRHSLRSLQEHWKGGGDLYVLTEQQIPWLSSEVKQIRAIGYMDAMRAACKLGDWILWMNDDIVFQKDTTWADLIPARRGRMISESEQERLIASSNGWRMRYGRIAKALREKGHTTWKFSTHTPYFYEAEKLAAIIEEYDFGYKTPIESAYFNALKISHQPVRDNDTVYADRPPRQGVRFFNTNDNGLSARMKTYLEYRFPRPSKWETQSQRQAVANQLAAEMKPNPTIKARVEAAAKQLAAETNPVKLAIMARVKERLAALKARDEAINSNEADDVDLSPETLPEKKDYDSSLGKKLVGKGLFNASIIKHKGDIIATWRGSNRSAEIGILDDSYNITRRKDLNAATGLIFEDMRLFTHGDKLLVSASQYRQKNPQMRLLDASGNLIDALESHNKNKWEKNWMFFELSGDLFYVYTTGEKHVVKRLHDSAEWVTDCPSWAWGQPRGGTPPIRIGDEFVSVFHSSISHSNNKRRTYYAALYKFSASPPFAITQWPIVPMMGGHDTNKKHSVVFPCGKIIDGDKMTVAYGKDDDEFWVAEFDFKVDSVRPVQRALEVMNGIKKGWAWQDKIAAMAHIIWKNGVRSLAEIGVFAGKSLFPCVEVMQMMGDDYTAYGIDPWSVEKSLEGQTEKHHLDFWSKQSTHDAAYESARNLANQYKKCDLLRMTSIEASSIVEDCDFIHIDGNHSQESALQDVILWFAKLKPNGFMVLDDSKWATVTSASDWLKSQNVKLIAEHESKAGSFLIVQRK